MGRILFHSVSMQFVSISLSLSFFLFFSLLFSSYFVSFFLPCFLSVFCSTNFFGHFFYVLLDSLFLIYLSCFLSFSYSQYLSHTLIIIKCGHMIFSHSLPLPLLGYKVPSASHYFAVFSALFLVLFLFLGSTSSLSLVEYIYFRRNFI